jgi:hypothetical protein
MANLILNGSTSGSVTLSSPAVSGTTTLTLPTKTSTLSIDGPTFSASQSTAQTISGFSLVQYQTKDWDTAGAFNNTGSTVTLNGISVPSYAYAPNIAGYYMVNASVLANSATSGMFVGIQKNASVYQYGTNFPSGTSLYNGVLSTIIYLNGTSDYIQFYAYFNTTGLTANDATKTWFNAAFLRSA